MMSRNKWTWGVGAVVVVLLLWAGCRRQSTDSNAEKVMAPEAAAESEHASSSEHEEGGDEAEVSHVSRSPIGETVITLDDETQERIGLRTELLASASHKPTVLAYGIAMEDPASSFTLRAPMVGIVRAVASETWPRLGETVEADTIVGNIVPRLTPAEQIDMAARLAAAHADLSSAAASLEAARASYQSKKELRDQGNVVSERSVEEAEAKVKSEEAQLEAATEIVRLIEGALAQRETAATTKPLIVPRRGQVVEAPVQPDEAVESGQPLLRIADLEQLIARVEVPVGEDVEGSVVAARISVVGQEGLSLKAEPLGLAPTVGGKTQGLAFLLSVKVGETPSLRPGAAVVAHLEESGSAMAGVMIPRGAVVRYGGLNWVYVKTAADRFTRREATLLSPGDGGWFTASSFVSGEEIVAAGAQMLLTEELKALIDREEEAAE